MKEWTECQWRPGCLVRKLGYVVLSFVIRWYNRNRSTKCLKRLQKRSIDDNLRQLVLIRQDRVLVKWSTCFFTSDSENFFFLTFPKKLVGRAMGNETSYGDGLIPFPKNGNELTGLSKWNDKFWPVGIFWLAYRNHLQRWSQIFWLEKNRNERFQI